MEDYLPTHLYVSFHRGEKPPDVVCLDGGKLTYRASYTLSGEVAPTPEQWREFWQEVDRLKVWEWEHEYYAPVIDGVGWNVHIVHGEHEVHSHGSNAFPDSHGIARPGSFKRFLKAVSRLLGRRIFLLKGVFMTDVIYLINDNDELVEMAGKEYNSEALLQVLLAKYPSLLAGEQMDSSNPRRWLLVSREAAVPSEDIAGRLSLDHLFLDQDAVPTLVEVKRSTDTRIRREVVGQMLDYAANAVAYWPIESIRAQFEANCQMQGVDAEEVLAQFLDNEIEPEEFWQKAKTSLQAGKVRLVFVADKIPGELRRIVEFLNTQMDPAEVLAVEIKQYVGQGLKTLVPRVIGQTAEAEQKKSGKKGLSETQEAYLKLYKELAEAIRDKIDANLLEAKPKHYYSIPTRIRGVHYEWSFHGVPRDSFAVELHFETSDRDANKRWLEKINKLSPQLEEITGEKVVVQENWGSRGWAKLYIEKSEREITDELKKWAVDNMVIFYKLLQPELNKLS